MKPSAQFSQQLENNSSDLVKIGTAAKTLKLSIDTIRRWEKAGKISAVRTPGGTRLFSQSELSALMDKRSSLGMHQENSISITKAAEMLGVSTKTLRRWDKSGRLSAHRGPNDSRFYSEEDLKNINKKVRKTPSEPIEQTVSLPEPIPVASEPVTTSAPLFTPIDDSTPAIETSVPETPRSLLQTFPQEEIPHITIASLVKKTIALSALTSFVIAGTALGAWGFLPEQIKEDIKTAHITLPKLPKLALFNESVTQPTQEAQVLGESTKKMMGRLNINIPTNLNSDVNIKGQLTIGTLTANNVIYSIRGSSGITVSSGQNPTITNSGVLSLAGQTGELEFTEGSGIDIDGLSITNSDKGTAQNIFKTIDVGGTTFSAGSNTDTLTFAGSSGVTVTTDTTNKKLTFSASGSALNVSGWTDGGTTVALTTLTDFVGIGVATADTKLHVIDTAEQLRLGYDSTNYTSFTTSSAGNLTIAPTGGTTNITGISSLNGNVNLGSSSSNDVAFNGRLTTSIIPKTDISVDLGCSSCGPSSQPIRFNNIYALGFNTTGITSTGQGVFTYVPPSTNYSDSTVIINPTSAPTSSNLLGVGIGGAQRAGIDAEGDLNLGYAGGAGTSVPTSDNPFNVYNHGTTLVASIDTSGNGTFANLITTNTTATLFNTTATTLSIGGAATTLSLGASTGTTAINNAATIGGGYGSTGVTISSAGVIQANGALTADGLITGTGGATLTGTVSINDSASTSTTSIGGGTTTGTVTVGGTGTQTLDIGNGAGVKTVNLGSTNTTSTTNINSGSGGVNINVSNNQPTNINTGTSSGTTTIGNSLSTTSLIGTLNLNTTGSGTTTIGSASAGAIALSTGGAFGVTTTTSPQTFTSAVVSGSTTSSAFVFTDNSLTTGTGMYLNSSSLTTGTLLGLSATSITTGNFLDISNGSSIFSVSNSAFTTSLPTNFTASGDVAITYDINFTNPTASFIKSSAPLNIVAGETFNSTNLTLQTYNQGTVVVDSAATSGTSMNILANAVTTGNGLLVNANGLTTGNAVSLSSTSTTGGASGSSYLLNLARSGANASATHAAYGISSSVTNTGTTSTNVGGLFAASGASTANYSLQTSNLTAVASAANAHLNIGTTSGTAASSTNTGILIGALSSTGTSNTGINIGALSGATTSSGIAIGALSSATSNGLTIGALSGTTANTGISIGNLSGASATGKGISIGNISSTGTTNYGLLLGTMTGGTTSNYQISTGILTSATTTTNAQIDLGGVVTTGGTTNYGITVGALSGSGTTNSAINIATLTSTGTTNTGLNIAGLSGTSGTNYGINIGTIATGATNSYGLRIQGPVSAATNYAIYADAAAQSYFAGNLGVGTTAPSALFSVGTGSTSNFTVTSAGVVVTASTLDIGSIPNTGNYTKALCWDDSGASQVQDCVGTAEADYMEMYPVEQGVELGDIVIPSNDYAITTKGNRVSKLTKSTGSYQSGIIGIISDKSQAGDFNSIGYNIKEEDNPQPIALNGRVQLKIASTSEPIKPGDYLTTSDEPGKAMKATHQGHMVAKALEEWSPTSGKKTMMVYVVNSYGDPNNFLTSLTFDQNGQLIAPIQNTNNSGDLSDRIENIEEILNTQDQKILSLEAKLATYSAQASPSAQASNSSDNGLNLTPPDILLATGSAKVADLTVASYANVGGKLSAYDLSVSNEFKALGKASLGSTTIAGDFSVDGTFSITQGNTIDALPTLYLQSSPLAESVNIFNGLVTIDKEGNVVVQTVSANEYKAASGKSIGTGKITSGTKTVTITTPLVKSTSRILVTPTTSISSTLAVTDKNEGNGFTVTIPNNATQDISFDWFIINEVN